MWLLRWIIMFLELSRSSFHLQDRYHRKIVISQHRNFLQKAKNSKLWTKKRDNWCFWIPWVKENKWKLENSFFNYFLIIYALYMATSPTVILKTKINLKIKLFGTRHVVTTRTLLWCRYERVLADFEYRNFDGYRIWDFWIIF